MEWEQIIKEESQKDYYKNLISFVKKESKEFTIFPPHKDLFNAFKLTPFDSVKTVILGQDCYHGEGQAHGLSFSVRHGISIPPSLQNIYKELKSDLGIEIPKHGCLESWAKQGVLLLNSIMTVRKGSPSSHKDKGWETFTDTIIKHLNNKETPIVFVLWGAFAKSKKSLIINKNHLILQAPHPSPFAAHTGFFGSKPFSQTNNFLINNNIDAIDWKL